MNPRIISLLCLAMLSGSIASGRAQGTEFTYQGQLKDTNGPVNGNYDFLFLVFDSFTNGIQQGITVGRFGVGVSNGLFTTTLDFGSNTFTGLPLWLEIQVAPAGTANFVTLAPRQPFTSTPYAIRALNAASAATATSVPWLALNGVPPGFADGVDDNTFYSAGAGLNLVGTTFSLNAAYTDTLYWKLAGNAGTAPGVNFLGTTDSQPLELKVNGRRALRLEDNGDSSADPDNLPDGAPNVIGGSEGNFVAAGVVGATIAGGGATNSWSEARTNVVLADHGTVGGGSANRIEARSYGATIAGGDGNSIGSSAGSSTIGGGQLVAIGADSSLATIAGGYYNDIGTNSQSSAIGGGRGNSIADNSWYATIAGGFINNIGTNSDSSAIGGGRQNGIAADSPNATIAGGTNNVIQSGANRSTITGGANHTIQTDARSATIGGGYRNEIQGRADDSTISGGVNNVIAAEADETTIGGGVGNEIGTNSIRATIGGGWVNRIAGTTAGLINGSTIAGGYDNVIEFGSGYSTVGGGAGNLIGTGVNGGTIGGGIQNELYAYRANIGGGFDNILDTNASYAVISGGVQNHIGSDARSAMIGGGSNNVIQAASTYATIGGGMDHSIAGTHGTIAGGEHHTIEAQAAYTTIGGGSDNAIQYNADYSTIAGGDNHIIRTNATWSTIGGGANNLIETNANYAVIPGGGYALASHHGQMAHASGRFASNGDAQTSVYVLRRTTTGSTPTELFLNGNSLRLTVPDGASWTFEALIVARSSAGDTAGYRLTGVVENVGSAMGGTFQAPQILREDVASWDASAITDNVNDALVIQVTGAAGTTIRWVAMVRTVEVTY